jgi:hypothetical protein
MVGRILNSHSCLLERLEPSGEIGVRQGMDAPFMYGSHYSCPGYVMFWMVRAAPGHLLRLQGGRFDAPDRLFCSVKEAWDSVTASSADVKELIPEFFLSDTRSVNPSQSRAGVLCLCCCVSFLMTWSIAQNRS